MSQELIAVICETIEYKKRGYDRPAQLFRFLANNGALFYWSFENESSTGRTLTNPIIPGLSSLSKESRLAGKKNE